MTNNEFLAVIRESFAAYLDVGTSRSTAKLKTLHGHIASDLMARLGQGYTIQSQGYGNDKEGIINGRYYPKNVDITVNYKGQPAAGYAVKFVMRNYSQNSNNYFENMLGETANIRSNRIPYFQVFIIFEQVPYYKKGGEFSRYDIITEHNISKYILLSKDDPKQFFHTPDKTLFILLRLKEKSRDYQFKNEKGYADYYRSVIKDNDLFAYSSKLSVPFDKSVIYNDYESFIDKTCHLVQGNV